ncbi:MAG: LLM class flavin-dependent oxidoreductase [Rhodospirillales bacterium]|nr:LLM class flavin-dependent oxidoreductase [Rhodospirillales bacterium]
MKFGIQFFPDIGPDQKSAQEYWQESLDLTEICDDIGYTHTRTVEHYFHRYGGYSANPLLYLASAAQRTKNMRLVTGAILPIFNNPLKIAAEIGEVDALSGGRLEVGFARAFLPHEFATFGRSLDESRARFNEGMEQVRRLLEEENVSMTGAFHSFENVTSLPRPTQKPRPPFWVATSSSTETFVMAGQKGYGVMTIPRGADTTRNWLATYRQNWQEVGHDGDGHVMFATHMYCAPTTEQAIEDSRPHLEGYFKALGDATADWTKVTSKDYPDHPAMIEEAASRTVDEMIGGDGMLVGSPDDIIGKIERYVESVGKVDHASLQVNFHTLTKDQSEASVRLFAEKVIPHFA